MECVAYRGIDLMEANKVINQQRYDEKERRAFKDGLYAKAVFGSGLYLVSNVIVAAEYAFCHAEKSKDKGAILSQTLHLENPLVLDSDFGEKELRQEALHWKYPSGDIEILYPQGSSLQLVEWTGHIIREYIMNNGHDGIVYYVNDDLIYYVSFYIDKQISNVKLEIIFDIQDFLNPEKIKDMKKLDSQLPTPLKGTGLAGER